MTDIIHCNGYMASQLAASSRSGPRRGLMVHFAMARSSYNKKRRLAVSVSDDERRRLLAIRYGGNPEHKRNPGDFGLTPPAQPEPDSSLCDEIAVFKRAEALALLVEGVRRGMISEQRVGDFPQNIWGRTPAGRFVEAQLENRGSGTYHGYPVPVQDPFLSTLEAAWQRAVRMNDETDS